MHAQLDFMGFLGLISLAGIILNHGIIMMDLLNREIRYKIGPIHAILHTARKRLRPILITTITTISCLIPLLINGGELWYAMCTIIIFGLAFGTIITLFILPIMYTYFYRVPTRKRHKPKDATL